MKTKHNKKILVSDANYNHTLGIVRSLTKAGYHVDCIGSRLSVCYFSKYLNKIAFDEKKFNEENINEFLEFLSISRYQYFIPIGAKSVYLTNKFRDNISKYTIIEIAPSESISLCLKKDKLVSYAKGIGIPVPETYLFNNYQDFLNKKKSIIFPVITKSSVELNKLDVNYHSNIFELDNYLFLNQNITGQILIQEKITGEGIGFFAIYESGKLKRYFMHRRLREIPLTGGSSTLAESYFNNSIYNYGKSLLDSLNWHGVAMVEFKYSRSKNDYYLMEVNPKFWGSHDLAISSGVNFAKEYVSLKKGLDSNYIETYNLDNKYQWPDLDFKTSFKNPRIFIRVLLDLINPKIKNNISLLDLNPTLYRIALLILLPILKLTGLYNFFGRVYRIGLKNTLVRNFTEFSGIPIPNYTFIDNQISIGMQHKYLGKLVLKLYNHNAILNLRSEFDDKKRFLNLKFYKQIKLDEFKAPSINQLMEGSEFINDVIKNNGRIYIHCREGVSRAPLFACSYLIRYRGLGVRESINYIKRKRIFINILPCQLHILNKFYTYIKSINVKTKVSHK